MQDGHIAIVLRQTNKYMIQYLDNKKIYIYVAYILNTDIL